MDTKILTRPTGRKASKVVKMLNTYVVEYEDTYLVFTAIEKASQNDKTGAMVQTYIIDKASITHSTVFGAKCSDCPLKDVCYVERDKLSVRGALMRLIKGEKTSYVFASLETVLPYLNGRSIRFGTYGDPSAIPLADLEKIASATISWTGYTHFWRDIPQEYSSLLMASVESLEGEIEAWSNGWRPFRVILKSDDVVEVTTDMIECPHYTSGVQCITCGLCKGKSSNAKGVYVFEH